MKKKERQEKTTRLLRYEFSNDELRELGKELAEAASELASTQAEKAEVVSSFAARVKMGEAKIGLLAGKVRSGYEHRDIDCIVSYNVPKTGFKTTRRTDNDAQVSVEKMTTTELQEELELNPAEEGGADGE